MRLSRAHPLCAAKRCGRGARLDQYLQKRSGALLSTTEVGHTYLTGLGFIASLSFIAWCLLVTGVLVSQTAPGGNGAAHGI